MMLAKEDPDKVARANRATSMAYRPALEKITGFDINWNIVSYPNASPGLETGVSERRRGGTAVRKPRGRHLRGQRGWTSRPTRSGRGKQHNANLQGALDPLAQRAAASPPCTITGPGTDLTIGLADEHRWKGGASEAKNGITCNPNIPTEEVFTTPHKDRVDGYVRSTKPLSHNGTLIEDMEVRFEAGRIVSAKASKGESVLSKVLDTDEGARRLGEVALVPHSSPISKSGVLFYNTLFDENAACHIALGQCYADCFVNGTKMSPDEIAARGGNKSLIHIDWMIGSGELDIDGVKADGSKVPVLRKGEWA
jgi:aminopeptidase